MQHSRSIPGGPAAGRRKIDFRGALRNGGVRLRDFRPDPSGGAQDKEQEGQGSQGSLELSAKEAAPHNLQLCPPLPTAAVGTGLGWRVPTEQFSARNTDSTEPEELMEPRPLPPTPPPGSVCRFCCNKAETLRSDCVRTRPF